MVNASLILVKFSESMLGIIYCSLCNYGICE